MTFEDIQKFMVDFIVNEEQYPDNICELQLSKDPNERPNGERIEVSDSIFTSFAMDPDNIGSYGLKFLIENSKDLVLNENVVEGIFNTVITIARRKKAENEQMPEDADQPDFEERRDEINTRNAEVEK